MKPTEISPQVIISEKLRSDINDILKRVEDTRSRSKAASACAFFQHGIVPKTSFIQTLISTPGHMANAQTVKVGVQEFWDGLRGKFNAPLSRIDLPDDLLTSLNEFASSFWEKASETALSLAKEDLEEQRRACLLLVSEAKKEAEAAKDAEGQALDLANRASGENAAIKTEILTLKEEATSLASKIAETMQANGVLEAQLASSSRQVADLVKSQASTIESYEVRLKAQIEEKTSLRESLEGEIVFAKQQIEAARMAERGEREKISSLEAKLESMQKERVSLEKQNTALILKNENHALSEVGHKLNAEAVTAKLKTAESSLSKLREDHETQKREADSAKSSAMALVEQLIPYECPTLSDYLEESGATLYFSVEAGGQPVLWCEVGQESAVPRTRGFKAFERAVKSALNSSRRQGGTVLG